MIHRLRSSVLIDESLRESYNRKRWSEVCSYQELASLITNPMCSVYHNSLKACKHHVLNVLYFGLANAYSDRQGNEVRAWRHRLFRKYRRFINAAALCPPSPPLIHHQLSILFWH